MKKLITLAVAAAFLAACDPYNDEPGGTPEVTYVWAGGVDADENMYGIAIEAAPWDVIDPDAGLTPTYAKAMIVKLNVLLDGASIETSPQSCDPAGDWLTVTGPALDPGTAEVPNQWYTCYYPSTATDTEPGGAVWVFYSEDPMHPLYPQALNNRPTVRPDLVPGDYSFSGTIMTKDGDAVDLAWTLRVDAP